MTVPLEPTPSNLGALVSVILLIVGTIVLTIGLVFAFGLSWAFITPGTIILVVGFALALRT